MPLVRFPLFLFCICFFNLLTAHARLSAAEGADSIVVLLSVDGLANFYLDDPKADIPVLRQLMKDGVRAASMKPSMPTVTWPNHTTLVTGVHPGTHGVLGNTVLDRTTGEHVQLMVDPIYNKDEIVRSPTIYDVAKGAGMKTAALIWPATRGATTLDWTVPDVGSLDLVKKYATPSLLKEFGEAGIPWEMQEEWWAAKRIRERDGMFVAMAKHVITRHRPQLLLMHLVELDHVQHVGGPQTPEAYDALKAADTRVGEIQAHLQKSHPGRATLLVVSDHGFFPFQQSIWLNVLLKQERLLMAIGGKITKARVRTVAQGGACFVYILDTENRAPLLETMTAKLKDVEGVARIIQPAEFAAFGLGDPAQNPQVPDLVVSAKSGYSFFDSPGGDVVVKPKDEKLRGTHGYDMNEPAMQATFIAWGAGIEKDAKLGAISNTSVAPTLAALLGLKMKDVDGPVPEELLQVKAAE